MKHDGKIKQMISDFSGKYHGKLSRKTAEKISIKCSCRKKGLIREIIRVQRESITEKIRIVTCAKHRLWLDT